MYGWEDAVLKGLSLPHFERQTEFYYLILHLFNI